jgi:TetR/AcrR family transcriptional regulator, repressor of fatR-cypB operon
MNIYSLIVSVDEGVITVARITDHQKIENVKRAAMEVFIEYGYRGASITTIANIAGVSTGYLYRYYASKEELLNDIMKSNSEEINSEITSAVKTSTTIEKFIYNIVTSLFRLVHQDPVKAKMAATIMLDSEFEKAASSVAYPVENIYLYFTELAKKTKEIKDNITEDDIKLTLLTIPFRYMSIHLKEKDYLPYFQEDNAKKLINLCLNALK